MLKNFVKNEYGGTAILMTVLILAGVLLTALAASDVVKNGLIMGRDRVYSTKAFFAAEAGAERVLYEVRQQDLLEDPSDGGIGPCASGVDFCFTAAGDFNSCSVGCVAPLQTDFELPNETSYTIGYEYSGGKNRIKCTGYYKDISRIVELTY